MTLSTETKISGEIARTARGWVGEVGVVHVLDGATRARTIVRGHYSTIAEADRIMKAAIKAKIGAEIPEVVSLVLDAWAQIVAEADPE